MPTPMADTRAATAAPGSLRRTLLLYLGVLLAGFAVALLFAARDYGQRAAPPHPILRSPAGVLGAVHRRFGGPGRRPVAGRSALCGAGPAGDGAGGPRVLPGGRQPRHADH